MTILLHTLRGTSPLPEAWTYGNLVEDTVQVEGLCLRRAGLSVTSPEGEEATGSAASIDEDPVRRSYFELLERASTLEALRGTHLQFNLWSVSGDPIGQRAGADVFPSSDAPEQWRYARSNGVAVHAGWRQACSHAFWELAERDRVLRAWYGESAIESMAARQLVRLEGTRSYRWRACRFPAAPGMTWSDEIEVAGVFGFPLAEGVPLVFGYAGRPELTDAIEAAEREATQQLAFLWGEEIPTSEPACRPSPVHHLDRFLWPVQHAVLERWLDGAHRGLAHERPRLEAPVSQEVRYVDLTPSWLCGGLRVSKALCDAATPLVFGESPFAAHLPFELRMHPVA